MTSRERFEAAYSNLMGTPTSVLETLRDGDGYRETDGHRVHISWLMWQASRAAIEVELPMRQACYASGYGDGYLVDCSDGDALYFDEAVEAIESQGLKVKK